MSAAGQDPLSPVPEVRRLGNSLLETPPPGTSPTPRRVTLDVVPARFRPLGRVIPVNTLPVQLLAPANPNRKTLHLNVRGGIAGTSLVALYGSNDIDKLYGGVDFPPFYGLDTEREYKFDCTGAFYVALVNAPDVSIWIGETLNPESQ